MTTPSGRSRLYFCNENSGLPKWSHALCSNQNRNNKNKQTMFVLYMVILDMVVKVDMVDIADMDHKV